MAADGERVEGLSPVKRAYLKLEELQRRLDAAEGRRREPIAVIGIGCRFPGGADGPEAFWRLLREGFDAVTEIPPDRWDVDAFYDPTPGTPGKMFTRAGSFVDDVDRFDPLFFGISPREAVGLDPQHRLLLEVAWESLENAGQAPDKLIRSQTGVFMGLTGSDYGHLQLHLDDPALWDAYYVSGNAHSTAAGRISYLLGFMGPCVSIDTACSSSLVAVHQACRSLREGDCRMALAGGVNLILTPVPNVAFCQSAMLSIDGRCRTFDAGANGFVHGEGCGVVVLKRLSDAIADGDRIDAVIRGSAINQDGPSTGLTVPNGPAQEAVIRAALEDAGVRPDEIGYLEAHGTGTSLGDPIEVQALGSVLGLGRSPERPVRIGSLKTNVGHLSAAAGIAGLIKLVLTLRAKEIPPSLHFHEPNPHIPWDRLPVRVNTELTPWDEADGGRIGGVSSFGFSGTNAHVVVGEAPAPDPDAARTPPPAHVVALSARTEPALRSLAGRHAERLASGGGLDVADVAYTLDAGRSHFKHRLAVRCRSAEEARDELLAYAAGTDRDGVVRGTVESPDAPRIAFLFTGQGSQYVGMGRALYETQPTFRCALERCDELLQPTLGRSLLPILYPESGSDGESLLDQTAYTQPALFAIEYALAELWRSWGVRPSVVMGHSLGEYVAACVAGVFTLESGLELVAERGRLMQALPSGGRMAAVFADLEQVESATRRFRDTVSIAGINGPASIVVSGDGADVGSVLEALEAEGVDTRPLTVSHAFHSPLMTPILGDLEAAAGRLSVGTPRVGLVSNLTGETVFANGPATAAYWRRHAREPVQFEASMRTLRDVPIFLEIGPHPTLLGMGARCLPDSDAVWVPSLRKGRDDWQQMLESLSTLYAHGVEIDWAGYYEGAGCRKVELPTYPFQRERYWTQGARWSPPGARGPRGSAGLDHPLLSRRVDTALDATLFEATLGPETTPLFYEHVVYGTPILPGAAVFEMMLAAGRELHGTHALTLADLTLHSAVVLPERGGLSVQLVASPQGSDATEVRLFSREEGRSDADWRLHAVGAVRAVAAAAAGAPSPALDLEAAVARCGDEIDVDALYDGFRRCGLDFGPTFHGVRRLWRRDGEALGELALPEVGGGGEQRYRFHPALLDACLQVVAAALPGFDPSGAGSAIYMPFELESLGARAPGGRPRHSLVRLEGDGAGETFAAYLSLFDEEGDVLCEIEGLHLKQADPGAFARPLPIDDCFYEVAWRELGAATEPAAGGALPGPHDVGEHVMALMPGLAAETGVEVYDELDRDLDALCSAYIAGALAGLGWSFEEGSSTSTEGLMEELGIVDQHRRLMDRFLEILSEDGLLTRSGDAWTVVARPAAEDPEELFERLAERYAECDAELQWTKQTGSRLAEALRGEVDPLDLLFPSGDLTWAMRVYRETPLARLFNTLTSEAVTAVAADLPADRPLRVLEIGAGTGATSAPVIRALAEESATYVFTDIGPAFVNRAKAEFGAYPFVEYRVLDIEQSPAEQGFTPDGFDVIIASNVLHATADLRRTLAHVRQLLAPGGMLFLLEVTAPQRWFDVTVGLTEGWWRFSDAELRPTQALLDADGWCTLLEETGFGDSTVVGGEPDRSGAVEQAMILCRKTDAVARPGTDVVAAEAPERWLIFSSGEAHGRMLTDRLAALGAECVTVRPSSDGAYVGGGAARIDATTPAHFGRLLQEVSEGGRTGPLRVAYLWALDAPEASALTGGALEEDQARACGGALSLVQALVSTPELGEARLCIVTRGARAVSPEGRTAEPQQATLWGLGKAIALEHPELSSSLIDLDPAGEPDEEAIGRLIDEVRFGAPEAEVALRGGRRLGARLERVSLASSSDAVGEAEALRWTKPDTGLLADMALTPFERRAPGEGEVEIEVAASALNFRDVLVALDVHHDFDSIGSECAGRVVRVGPGVDGLEAGDEVVAIAPRAFSTFVTANAHLVSAKPADMDFEAAVTLPIAFLTAQYALSGVGRMKAGDVVLIHSAAGGVGMAALQLARAAGATVLATAGSPEKRSHLRAMGVEHVMDSRSLDFADEVLGITEGRGVDLLLNALTGEAIERGLSILAPGGRFLELGKSDVWTEERASEVNPRAHYHAVDLTGDIHTRPETVAPMLTELMDAVERGAVEPLPRRIFPFDDAVGAFRFMEQALHIGKVVLSHPRGWAPAASVPIRGDGTYVITGGLGGLGLLVAEWLTGRGARHLILAGRSGPTEEAAERIRALEADGVRVVVSATDVSREEELAELFARADADMPPVRGVVHSAGVLDDGVLLRQSWDRFATVMAPKVSGAWLLHEMTRERTLDFFVLFSSVASLLGGSASGNHSAANAFLDALAWYRRGRGLPGASINWGAWSEVGAAVRESAKEWIQQRGLGFITPVEGLDALRRVMDGDHAQVGVMRVDWPSFMREHENHRRQPFFGDLSEGPARPEAVVGDAGAEGVGGDDGGLRDALEQAYPNERRSILVAHVEGCAARVLGLASPDALDRQQPLSEMGMDSLMAIELRNLLRGSVGAPLPATLLFDYPTVQALSDHLAGVLGLDDTGPASDRDVEAEPEDLVGMVESMSEEEIDRIFEDELKGGSHY